ncbi:MAG: TonB-dependent receptor [Ignavibacteriae bacterium]|nr:TonB-dependent receptor [Ignavibacteriota bacterium]
MTQLFSLSKKTIILCLLLVFTLQVFGQQNDNKNVSRNIKGFIKDAKTGEPLVYANIMIKNTSVGTSSNLRGYFILPDVPDGESILVVSYIGYKTKEIPIKNFNAEIKIELEQSNYSTDEVVVVADQYKFWKSSELVGQITIAPASLSKLPNLGEKDIFRSLQYLPGISAINDGSSGLYIRGGTPDQNLVLLDGITVYHVDHFFGFYSAFNADAIKDVQVYKGGFDAKYGGRISSVVDLTGKTGDMNNFRLSLGGSLLSLNGVAEIPLKGKGSILLSARRSYADLINIGLYDDIFNFLSGEDAASTSTPKGTGRMNQTTVSTTPSFYFYDFNSKLSYQLSDKDFIAVSIYNGQDYLDESQDPTTVTLKNNAGSASRKIDDVTDWGNIGSSIKLTRQWSDYWFSDFTIAYSNYFSKNNVNNSFDLNVDTTNIASTKTSSSTLQDNNVRDFTLKFDNEYSLSLKHKLGFGAWFSNIETDYLYTVNDTLNIIDTKQNGYHFSGYVQDKWNITNELDLNLGLRTTYFNPTKNIYLEPRFSFRYKVNDLIKVKGGLGQYYQYINQVTSEDVLEGSRDFWLISSEELQPGSSQQYTLGTEFETPDYLFSVEGYYKNIDNLLEFTQRIVRSQQSRQIVKTNYVTNFFQGTGISKGVEFLAQKKFGDLSGWVSYTLSNVEYTFPEFDDGDPFPANQDKTHELKFILAYETGNWNFSAAWIYASGAPYTAPQLQYSIELLDGIEQSYIHVSEKNVYQLPDYHRLDLSGSYRFARKTFDGELGLSIFNVYNRENVWYKKYDLTVSPVEITNVSMLGFTPTLFVKFNF